MEKFTTDGIVLKTSVTGESDRIVYILTAERGVIRAFAKGARSPKSRLHAGTAQFVYGSFSFSEKNGVFNVRETMEQQTFFSLSLDLKKLTLAQYFCEVLLRVTPDGDSDPEYLRLMLNALYVLSREKKTPEAVKAVFELRLTAMAGYSPSLIACDTCGAFQTPGMYFHCETGKLYCERCGEQTGAVKLPLSVISAMRHIVFSSSKKIFSFEMSHDGLLLLSKITETYEKNCFQQKFRLLEFYYAVN